MLSQLKKKKTLIGAFAATMLVTSTAFAIYAKMRTALVSTNSAVGGKGMVYLDQKDYQTKGAVFSINVSGLKLPNGTVIQVRYDRCWGSSCVIGYLSLYNGAASATWRLPTYMKFGRYDAIAAYNSKDTYNPPNKVLAGGNPWEI